MRGIADLAWLHGDGQVTDSMGDLLEYSGLTALDISNNFTTGHTQETPRR